MSYPVFVLGESGTGKSTSLRNLKPSDCTLVQVVKKPLPFKSKDWQRFDATTKKGNVFCFDDAEKIIRVINGAKTPIVIIDDFQYLMANEFLRRSSERGFDKFTEIAKHAHSIIEAAANSNNNKRIYILSHTETGDDDITRIKTIGKLLNEKITLEGLVTMVLRTHVESGSYQFSTRNNGKDTVKTPFGMFDSQYIDNDLLTVDNAIKDFYDINDSIDMAA